MEKVTLLTQFYMEITLLFVICLTVCKQIHISAKKDCVFSNTPDTAGV